MTTESGFPEALKKDSYEWYWESYDELPKVYDKIFKVENTEVLYEKSTSAVGTGLLEEKQSTAKITEKSPIEGYITHSKVRDWGKKEGVTKAVAEDVTKLGNFLKSQMPIWSKDAVETIETFCANHINYGGYTSGQAIFNQSIPGVLDYTAGNFIYDGKPLFAASGNDHTSKGGTSYYNGLGALNATPANIQTAYNRMAVYNNRKEDDTLMRNTPDIILSSPALKFTIDPLFSSQTDPSTVNRADNPLFKIVQPLYWDYLTDADQWQLVNTKMGSFVLYMRENPEFDLWEDKDTKCYYMSIYMRFGVMIKNWRPIVSANYSTS